MPAVRAAIAQEFAQQAFRGARRQAVQVELFLRGVFAAGEALEDLWRHFVAPITQQVAGFQRGDHRMLERLAGGVLVAAGHLRRGLRLRRGGRQWGVGQGAHLAAVGADRLAEQRGIVQIVVGGWRLRGRIFSHRRRVSQRPSVIMPRMHNVSMP